MPALKRQCNALMAHGLGELVQNASLFVLKCKPNSEQLSDIGSLHVSTCNESDDSENENPSRKTEAHQMN